MSNRERNLYLIVPLVWLILLGMALGVAALRHQPAMGDEGGVSENRDRHYFPWFHIGLRYLARENSVCPGFPLQLTLLQAHAIIGACPLNRRALPPLPPPWTI